jgi:hypothetical protein
MADQHVDDVVYFLNRTSKTAVNVNHVLVPTTSVLANHIKVIETAIGTALPAADIAVVVPPAVDPEHDQLLARHRGHRLADLSFLG